MDFKIILPLAIAVIILGLGLLVYLKNRKNIVNISFALLALAMAIWSFALVIFYISSQEIFLLFWAKVIYFVGGLIAACFFYFSSVFATNKVSLSRFKQLLIFVPNIIFFFLYFFSDFIISGVFTEDSNRGFFYGPGHILFDLHFDIFFITAFWNLFQKYKRASSLSKTQTLYIIVGSLPAVVLAGITNVIFPWFKIFQWLWIGPLLTITWPISIAYAIIRYRLMDIRMTVKRSTIFSGIVIAVTMLYALVAFLSGLAAFGGGYTFKSQLITGLIVAVAVAFGFRPLYEWLKRTTDAFLFKGEYRPEELMADITDILSRTLEMDKIIQTVKEKVKKALRVGEMEVVVFEEEEMESRSKNQELRIVSAQKTNHGIVSSSPSATPHNDGFKKFINYFKDQREVLVLEELQRRYADRTKFDKSFLLIKEMEKLKAALLVPLFLKEKLVGLFLLGTKKSGDMFTNEDIKTMETVASQAAIAIENSRLYEEMKDFSKTLQKEVERQTKTLREANIKLEQLDKAKSEFISIASHQLRTPLSIIKGYISMLLEGLWGEVSPEQKRHLEMVYISNERLIKLIEDLLMVSRIEAGRLEFEWQMVSLDGLAENVVEELKPLADKKGLYLRYEKPAKPLPKIKADPLKIRQVIMNLIDNAIHYTEKGGATVRLKAEKDKVIFSIQDTGIGISAKDKVALFEKFSRGKGISKLHTEGTGLGLYLAAKLVEAHRGRIWVESEGEGKGSVFCFELGTSFF